MNNIFNILPSISLISAGTLLPIVMSKKRFEEILPLVIFSIVISLYIFGIFNFLKIGFYFVNTLLIISCISGIFYSKNNFKETFKNFFSPGFFLYLFWCLLVYFLVKDAIITHHDDLMHWGLAAKNTFLLDAIAVGQKSNTVFQDYPPATALLQYWILKIHGSFNDSLVLMSASIWGYSLIAYMAKNLKWSDSKTLALYSVAGLAIPMSLKIGDGGELFYTTLMVDYLMAIVFGYLLLLVFTLDKKISKFSFFNLLVTACCLVIIKKVGIFLSFISLALVTTRIIFENKEFESASITRIVDKISSSKFQNFLQKILNKILKSFNRQDVDLKNNLALIVIIFAPWMLAVISWKLCLAYNSVPISNVNNNFSYMLSDLFSVDLFLPQRAKEITILYLGALYEKNLTNGIVTLSAFAYGAIALFSSYCFYLCKTTNASKSNFVRNFIVLFVFFVIYLFGHFMMYLTVLSDGESFGLSSFDRYLLVFSVGILFATLGVFIDRGYGFNENKFRLAAIAIMMFCCTTINFSAIKSYTKWVSSHQKEDNSQIIRMAKIITQTIDIKDLTNSVCLIESTAGIAYGDAMVLRNMLIPLKVKRYIAWEPLNEKEKSRHKIQFENEMKDCSYVIISDVKKVLTKNYKKYFHSKIISGVIYTKNLTESNAPSFKFAECLMCK